MFPVDIVNFLKTHQKYWLTKKTYVADFSPCVMRRYGPDKRLLQLARSEDADKTHYLGIVLPTGVDLSHSDEYPVVALCRLDYGRQIKSEIVAKNIREYIQKYIDSEDSALAAIIIERNGAIAVPDLTGFSTQNVNLTFSEFIDGGVRYIKHKNGYWHEADSLVEDDLSQNLRQ